MQHKMLYISANKGRNGQEINIVLKDSDIMSISRFVAYIQDRIEKRRAYNRLVAEIDSLSQRDLIELGAFQADLYRAARQEIFGH